MPWSSHFAFVQSARARALVRRSRVIFLMRGLTGSGKSQIVEKHIAPLASTVVVCSADNFLVEDGKYGFNRQKLRAAHSDCFRQSMEAAVKRVPLICIDNQHATAWTTHRALILARGYQYMIFMLEARTPWRRSPIELSQKNIHGVPHDQVERVLASYEPVLAENYGWFLPRAETSFIHRVARHCFSLLLSRSFEFSVWYNELSAGRSEVDSFARRSTIDPQQWYTTPDPVPFANATPFLNGSAAAGDETVSDLRMRLCYGTSRKVCSNLTSASPLRVFSVYFTPRSCGARVFVPNEVSHLCEPVEDGDPGAVGVECSADAPTLSDDEIAALQDRDVTWEERDLHCPFASPEETGALVHIRLGQGDDLGGNQCREDLRDIVRSELAVKSSQASSPDSVDSTMPALDDATVRRHGDAWVVYFKTPREIQGLFTGSYSTGKLSAAVPSLPASDAA